MPGAAPIAGAPTVDGLTGSSTCDTGAADGCAAGVFWGIPGVAAFGLTSVVSMVIVGLNCKNETSACEGKDVAFEEGREAAWAWAFVGLVALTRVASSPKQDLVEARLPVVNSP